jgi:CYTH domain-containing protein
LVEVDNNIWEIDVFEDSYTNLVIAEVELKSMDDNITIPPWIGIEVTDDPQYANKNMAMRLK